MAVLGMPRATTQSSSSAAASDSEDLCAAAIATLREILHTLAPAHAAHLRSDAMLPILGYCVSLLMQARIAL